MRDRRRNDEVFGNLDDPCNSNYDDNTTSDIDQRTASSLPAYAGTCRRLCQPFELDASSFIATTTDQSTLPTCGDLTVDDCRSPATHG